MLNGAAAYNFTNKGLCPEYFPILGILLGQNLFVTRTSSYTYELCIVLKKICGGALFYKSTSI